MLIFKKKATIFLLLAIFLLIIGNVLLLIKLYRINEQFRLLKESIKSQVNYNFLKDDKDKSNYLNYIMDELEIYLAEKNGNKKKFSIIDSDIINTLNNRSIKKLTNDACYKSHLKISPNNLLIGYYVDLNCLNGNVLHRDYENHTSLRIMDLDGKNNKEIYTGSYHTSDWEWLNDDEVVVYYGCGTECMVGFVVDVKTRTRKAQLQYGVGYEWSPNKKYILAYNYSGKYGITVGDKKEEVFLSIKREPSNYDLIGETKAIWSPDSKKLTLIIKKEGVNEMEILIFETDNFDMILQSDIEFTKDAKFTWAGNNKIIFDNKEFLIE